MELLLIADDLTGANVTGAALSRVGVSAFTAVDLERGLTQCDRYQALLCNTDSRSTPAAEAYRRVRAVLEQAGQHRPQLLVNRIDSTLRGNLGASTRAFLDYMGEDAVALVVPAMPQGGRTCVDGKLLVRGVPLDRTAAAQDPKTPIATADVRALFAAQIDCPAAFLGLGEVRLGKRALRERMEALSREGKRLLLFDGETDGDVEAVVRAARESSLRFFAVDPGAFTAALAARYAKPPPHPQSMGSGRILLAVGSVNEVTREQVSALGADIYRCLLSTDRLCGAEAVAAAEVDRAVAELLEREEDACCLLLDSLYPQNRIDFGARARELGCNEEALSRRVNDSVARVVDRLLEAGAGFSRLFSCGGDITLALCRNFGASGMEIRDQVLPLVMYGALPDGRYPGCEIITKGGMVGERDALLRCVDYYRRRGGRHCGGFFEKTGNG